MNFGGNLILTLWAAIPKAPTLVSSISIGSMRPVLENVVALEIDAIVFPAAEFAKV